MKTSGFTCKDGIISFSEDGRPIKIFLSEDGSLNVQDGEGGITFIPGFMVGLPIIYPIPAPYGTSENYYKWVKVDAEENPYANCPEVQ
jgi:hypothetical protein